jgi:hypothetical protein
VLDQRLQARKQHFGMELYDRLPQQADQDPMFIIDHPALENIQGLFVTCYKDNKALMQKNKTPQFQLEEAAELRRCVTSRHFLGKNILSCSCGFRGRANIEYNQVGLNH